MRFFQQDTQQRFEEIYRHKKKLVYTMIGDWIAKYGDYDTFELKNELNQKVWLALTEKRETLVSKPDWQVNGYIRNIVRNIYINHVRDSIRERNITKELEILLHDNNSVIRWQNGNPIYDNDAKLWSIIEHIVDNLSEVEQEHFYYRHVKHMKTYEIAMLFGKTPHATRKRLERITTKIREEAKRLLQEGDIYE